MMVYYTIISLAYLIIMYALQRKFIGFRRPLLVGYVVFQLTYLIWRVVATIPTQNIASLVAGSSLYVAELMGFIQAISLVVLFWTPYKRESQYLTEDAYHPTVDLLIATYNESESILATTIVGALNIDYPEDKLNIILCDDGNRESVRQLAEIHGIGYIARSSNEHAKAGNLNHALTQTTGEIIVTQDADMIPKQDFLIKTLAYFQDETVGFVQSPQTFYNADIFQHNLYLDNQVNNEQDFFMRSLQAAKDRFNAIIYIGSNALFRREALESIGGFTTGVITEDMATGLLLSNEGWQSVFVNESLAVGLSAETLSDYMKQRDRWGRGNIQVIKKYPLKKLPNLTFIQKWMYLDGVIYWLSGLYKIIYLVLPTLYILFGIASLQTTLHELLIYWAPAFLSSQLMFKAITRRRHTTLMSYIYELSVAPQVFWSVFKELLFSPKKNKKFHVTIKGVSSQNSYFDWRNCLPQMALLLLNIAAIAATVVKVVNHELPWQAAVTLNTYWNLYNIVVLTITILVAIERPRLPMLVELNSSGFLVGGTVQPLPVKVAAISQRRIVLSLTKSSQENLKDVLRTNDCFISFENIELVSLTYLREIETKNEQLIVFKRTRISKDNYYKWLSLIFSNPEISLGNVNERIPGGAKTLINRFVNRRHARKMEKLLLEQLK